MGHQERLSGGGARLCRGSLQADPQCLGPSRCHQQQPLTWMHNAKVPPALMVELAQSPVVLGMLELLNNQLSGWTIGRFLWLVSSSQREVEKSLQAGWEEHVSGAPAHHRPRLAMSNAACSPHQLRNSHPLFPASDCWFQAGFHKQPCCRHRKCAGWPRQALCARPPDMQQSFEETERSQRPSAPAAGSRAGAPSSRSEGEFGRADPPFTPWSYVSKVKCPAAGWNSRLF